MNHFDTEPRREFTWADRAGCEWRRRQRSMNMQQDGRSGSPVGQPYGHYLCSYGFVGQRCMRRLCPKLMEGRT